MPTVPGLRDARVGYTGLVVRNNSVEVRLREGTNVEQATAKLRELSPLWEMHKEGIDLNTVQWAAH